MNRTQIIDHQGKKIFFIDFSDLTSVAEIKKVILDAQKYICSQPKSSVNTLTSVEGTHFNNEIKDLFADFLKGNKPFVKASAIIGISGLKQIMFNSLMVISGRDSHSFSTLDQAKDWLTRQK